MIKTPEITINGKVYKAAVPKAAFWRKMVKFEETVKSVEDGDYLAAYADIIAEAFGAEEVTGDAVLDSLNIDQVKPLYLEIWGWLFQLVNSKLEQIPNAESPEA